MTYPLPPELCEKMRKKVRDGATMKEVAEGYQEAGKPWGYATVRRHVVGECSHEYVPNGEHPDRSNDEVWYPPVDPNSREWKEEHVPVFE